VENHDTDVEQVHELLKKEWDFTSEKIYQNFSNGSAFHYRSKLMPMLLHYDLSSSSEKTRSDWVQEELELIRNAIFTEPDDQTSWWYFRFVLAWANPMTYQKDGEDEGLTSEEGKRLIGEYMGILFEEWTSIQELVEAEDGKCKWGLLGMYMIATTFNELAVNGIQEAISYEGEDWLELAQSYLRELKELDPDRKHRYESMER
jgi:geranylgeranyl transferase type-2 subunit alpha